MGGVPDKPRSGAPVLWFADAARRLGAATRAGGLVVPAFRCPPRVPGATRTVRRYPGGAVVSVTLKNRLRDEVAADMVEGVLVVNHLEGEAALRFRTALLEATGAHPHPPAPSDVPSTPPPSGARVAERQTQAA
ncbi:MAG: hypothetical protein MUP97_19385 [Acidimicrobiia bacterium]|nr:hypothetical protein [Acidimicrobiia bacterium]